MSTIRYQKLVRDYIPEIIENSGKQCVYTILTDAEYIRMLDAKLNEELLEYQESKSIEELADLLEVIRAIAIARGSSIEEIEAIRMDKVAKRGSFERKIQLIEVRECEE
jgi:predicted house-cleaning noncanonical NTP pyrophosphatase (MazG superfamily)